MAPITLRMKSVKPIRRLRRGAVSAMAKSEDDTDPCSPTSTSFSCDGWSFTDASSCPLDASCSSKQATARPAANRSTSRPTSRPAANRPTSRPAANRSTSRPMSRPVAGSTPRPTAVPPARPGPGSDTRSCDGSEAANYMLMFSVMAHSQQLRLKRRLIMMMEAIKAVKRVNVMKVYELLHDRNIEEDISFLAPSVSTINHAKKGSKKIVDIYNSALQSRYLYNRFLANKRLDLLLEEAATKLNLFKVELEWLLFNLICNRKITDADSWSLLLKQIDGFQDTELKTTTYTVIASLILTKELPKNITFTRTPAYLVMYYCLYHGDVSQLAELNLDELTVGFNDLTKLKAQRELQRVGLNKGLALQYAAACPNQTGVAVQGPGNDLARELLLRSAGTKRLGDLIKKFNISQNKEVYFYLVYLHNRSILGLTTAVNLFHSMMSSVW